MAESRLAIPGRSGTTHQVWSNKLDYVLSTVGYCVGTGSILGWPYLCMRNGGGAFLIPFIIFTILATIPCVFLEMTIGQLSQTGTVSVWNLCPPFKGIGVGAILISWIYASYNSVFLSWFLYYFYHSFSANIPWTTCDNEWNTPACISHTNIMNEALTNSSNTGIFVPVNANTSMMNTTDLTSEVSSMTAAEEFWRFHVLKLTSGLDVLGGLRGSIVGCFAFVYIAVFLCIFKGIKVSGKIVYVTVGVPYILVTVFLIRGCLLPGAADGIYYYIYPKFERLLEPAIWIDACRFALSSLGISLGCLITLAGHNKRSNNCFRDAITISLLDQGTSVYCGFAFFSIMGYVARIRGVTVDTFESSGFSLGFIVYPEAVASLPLPQLWSALMFLLMVLLGIDSLAPCFEIIVTALTEQFPSLAPRRWMVILGVLLPTFIIGLVYTSQGGIYVLTLVEWYAYFPSMLVFIFLECIVVTWIYGKNITCHVLDRLNRDIMMMWGKTTPRVMSICLKFICPVLVLVLFCYSVYTYRTPRYGDYIYPVWASGIGWIISFATVVSLPIIFIWTVYRTQGNTMKERLQNALKPNMMWGPTDTDAVNRGDDMPLKMSLNL